MKFFKCVGAAVTQQKSRGVARTAVAKLRVRRGMTLGRRRVPHLSRRGAAQATAAGACAGGCLRWMGGGCRARGCLHRKAGESCFLEAGESFCKAVEESRNPLPKGERACFSRQGGDGKSRTVKKHP